MCIIYRHIISFIICECKQYLIFQSYFKSHFKIIITSGIFKYANISCSITIKIRSSYRYSRFCQIFQRTQISVNRLRCHTCKYTRIVTTIFVRITIPFGKSYSPISLWTIDKKVYITISIKISGKDKIIKGDIYPTFFYQNIITIIQNQ